MLKGFLLAVAAGTVAGTAFPAIILAIAIFGSTGDHGDLRTGIGIAMMAIVVPLALVATSAVALGIPLTMCLRKLRMESEAAYLTGGGFLGFLVPGIILAGAERDPSVFINSLPAGMLGAFSGAVTGRSWWRNYREGVLDGSE